MSRNPRIESSDGLYHIINRGNYRAYIFESEGARMAFQKTLFEACERSGWRLYAYCIMSNHFHLCIGTPKGNLSEGMRWLQATFAARFHKYRKVHGHLFQGRFKSLVVEPGSYWLSLIDYIHLNPFNAGIVDQDSLSGYNWSSLWYFPKRSTRPSFMDASWLDYTDDCQDSKGGWVRYLNTLKLRSETNPKLQSKLEKDLNSGWCIGSKEFKEDLASEYFVKKGPLRMEKKELKEFNELQWEKYVQRALAALNLSEEDIANDPYSIRWKLAIASQLKRTSSTSNAWLSRRLKMGVPNAVSNNCGRYQREEEGKCKYAKQLMNMKYEH
jgi:REP element-mobilizing transposase RayT